MLLLFFERQIILDHYNLCKFQRLYNYTKKKKKEGQTTCRITQTPSSKCIGIEILKEKINGTETNLQSDELA